MSKKPKLNYNTYHVCGSKCPDDRPFCKDCPNFPNMKPEFKRNFDEVKKS
jgi:hypothetical protein